MPNLNLIIRLSFKLRIFRSPRICFLISCFATLISGISISVSAVISCNIKRKCMISTNSQSIFRKLVLIKDPCQVSIWQRKPFAKFEIIFCKQNVPVLIFFVSFEGSSIDLWITRIGLFIEQLIIVMYATGTGNLQSS
jgi:hypothetical protein